jgi:hypothetical protein
MEPDIPTLGQRISIYLFKEYQQLRDRLNQTIVDAESTLVIAMTFTSMNQGFQTVISSGQPRGPLNIFGNDLKLVPCIICSSRSAFLFTSIRPWIS